jgi:uncharacterized 2Fe-2S/4Fe-4S cluster protein (DUF4445 family)
VEDAVQVVFLPSNRRGTVERGSTLSEAAVRLGEGIESICGGRGVCGKCKVRILQDTLDEHGVDSGSEHLSHMDAQEERSAERMSFRPDERMACRARAEGDLVLFVPEESRRARTALLKGIRDRTPEMLPAIRKIYTELSSPDGDSPPGAWDRLAADMENRFSLQALAVDPAALQALPAALEKEEGKITATVWQDREVIRVEPGYRETACGLAVDLGTTTVAAYLCDLRSGELLATESVINPQVEFGEDIMTRVAGAAETGVLHRMQRETVRAVTRMAQEMTGRLSLTPEDIAEAVVAGNTVMHHIFLGLDVQSLGRTPFSPVLSRSVTVRARDLGLGILPSAPVHMLPIEAGFVGADNVAVLLAEEPHTQDEVLLIIDIGTNGEIVLGNRNRLLCASCATGPAFEGGCIRFGMRASPGAIERVRIAPGTLDVSFRIIEHPRGSGEHAGEALRARGICGSGIIDAAAEMLAAGIIRPDGRFNKSIESPRLRRDAEGRPEFIIARAEETSIGQEICVTQGDIRAVQLAKAAILAGCRILLERLGREKPDRVILAGAFGTEIDRERALAMGLFPDCGLEKISAVGNAAGDGARIALLNRDKREEADRIARRVEHVSLTTDPGFTKIFIDAIAFPDPSDGRPEGERRQKGETR